MGERLSVSWRRCSGCWAESIGGRGAGCEMRVCAYDPVASQEEQRIFAGETGIEFVGKPMEVLQGAEVLAIVSEWKEFRAQDCRVDGRWIGG